GLPAMRGGARIGRHGLDPARARLPAVEGQVLAAVEQVAHGTTNAREAVEVLGAGWIDIHAADADHAALQAGALGPSFLEAGGPATQAEEQVKVVDVGDHAFP